MRKYFYLIIAWLFAWQNVNAQEEKLLYSTNFQDWATVPNSASEEVVAKTTDFTSEELTFKLLRININPTGRDETRFNYNLVSNGWAMSDKHTDTYMELTPLASVTKVIFTHGATGGNRGYRLEKKSAATNDQWIVVSSAVANPAQGQTVTADINDENVALRFTNLTTNQNAYMFDLKIYGNYTPTGTQYALTTSVNISGAGAITRTPNSDEYTEGSEVSLSATPKHGYKFLKWVDADNADAELSTNNAYVLTMDADKNIKAVFEAVTTYNFTITKIGSQWGEIELTPEPVNGKYEEGTEVIMRVIPNPVTTFSYWEDNSTVLQRTVTVNADATYTATFDEIPFIVGWNFKDQNIRQSKTGDYYAETTNTGSISAHEPSGVKVNWLSNGGSFSPSLPNIRLWTDEDKFLTNRRYVQAQFSTVGYTNIEVKSMVSANTQAYSIMTLQYSLDGNSFTELNRVDITDVFNSGWKDLNVTLPIEAEGQSMIYIRWIADATSTIIGSGKDGAALTNVYVYADKEIVNDTEAPVLISIVPANASNTATINGSIVLTFNERVQAGTGDVTLDSKTLTGIYGSKTATFAYEKLQYDTEYTLTVPSGAITDMSGNAYVGITITFRTGVRTEPVKKLFDAVVAKDGSGDYTSIIEAINQAPTGRTAPWVIFIKNGIYTGHHVIPVNKPFIHLIGQSRNGVVISDNRNSPTYGMRDRATFWVGSTDCYFENLTIENSLGREQGAAANQADALSSENDKFAMKNVYLRSFQDTYQTSAVSNNATHRHYVLNSRIEGGTDFIYGGGDVFFDRDTLTLERNGTVIVAPSHPTGTAWGYVFKDCVINKDRYTGTNSYFGRPWQNSPKAVFLNTRLLDGVSIHPEGWNDMGALPIIFADYGTMDNNGNLIDVSQRKSTYSSGGINLGTAKNSLTDEEAAEYTYENVILRAGDSWDPRMIAEAPEQPVNVQVTNSHITWDATAYTRLYVVIRNNEVIGFSTTNEFTDNTAIAGTNYSYKIQAASEYGALSIASEPVETLPVTGLQVKAVKINQSVQINWSTFTEKGTSHFIIERTLDGKTFEEIGSRQAVGNSNSKQEYFFTDKAPAQGTNIYRIKAVDLDGYFEYSEPAAVKFAEYIGLTVYPNPASGQIRISFGKEMPNVNIYDLSGQKMLSLENVQDAQPIDISALHTGVYIIEVNNGISKSIVRFVKN